MALFLSFNKYFRLLLKENTKERQEGSGWVVNLSDERHLSGVNPPMTFPFYVSKITSVFEI